MSALPKPLHAGLIDFLYAELDKKLNGMSSDNERYRALILQGNVWRADYARYMSTGEQPFGGPHPVYGAMDHFDFAMLLADIEARKIALERAKVPA